MIIGVDLLGARGRPEQAGGSVQAFAIGLDGEGGVLYVGIGFAFEAACKLRRVISFSIDIWVVDIRFLDAAPSRVGSAGMARCDAGYTG